MFKIITFAFFVFKTNKLILPPPILIASDHVPLTIPITFT